MEKELQQRLNDLCNRWDGDDIEVNITISEDFKVEEVCLTEETLCISYCGAMLYDFPMSALNNDIIEEILDNVEIEVEREETEIDKVLDNNYWAGL